LDIIKINCIILLIYTIIIIIDKTINLFETQKKIYIY